MVGGRGGQLYYSMCRRGKVFDGVGETGPLKWTPRGEDLMLLKLEYAYVSSTFSWISVVHMG